MINILEIFLVLYMIVCTLAVSFVIIQEIFEKLRNKFDK